jgi:hypothetical protein
MERCLIRIVKTFLPHHSNGLMLQHSTIPGPHNSTIRVSSTPTFHFYHICHFRMLLSLDFPRDDEVLEPSGSLDAQRFQIRDLRFNDLNCLNVLN